MPKPSSDESALLKAICRHPDDDLPRLVYADWLDEHDRGDRAEFIRLQCELAAAGHTELLEVRTVLSDPRRVRQYELWRNNHERWLKELPRWTMNPLAMEFVRGFPERFQLTAAPFLSYGPQLLDRVPVRGLQLVQLKNVIPELVRCVWLREVPDVYLAYEQLGDEFASSLGDAEWLAGIRTLDLSGNMLRDDAARSLARNRHLAGVQTLSLVSNRLTLSGVQALVSSPFLGPRVRYYLQGNPAAGTPHHLDRLLPGRWR